MRANIKTAALIRSVTQVKNGNSDFGRLLPLMNVSYVRNKQLTVIPFPFKYLREYILSLENQN